MYWNDCTSEFIFSTLNSCKNSLLYPGMNMACSMRCSFNSIVHEWREKRTGTSCSWWLVLSWIFQGSPVLWVSPGVMNPSIIFVLQVLIQGQENILMRKVGAMGRAGTWNLLLHIKSSSIQNYQYKIHRWCVLLQNWKRWSVNIWLSWGVLLFKLVFLKKAYR